MFLVRWRACTSHYLFPHIFALGIACSHTIQLGWVLAYLIHKVVVGQYYFDPLMLLTFAWAPLKSAGGWSRALQSAMGARIREAEPKETALTVLAGRSDRRPASQLVMVPHELLQIRSVQCLFEI